MNRAWVLALALLGCSSREATRSVPPLLREGDTAEPTKADAPPTHLEALNPILGADHPDPHVLRVLEGGKPAYYLTTTIANGGDLPMWKSSNLIDWAPLPQRLFDQPSVPGAPLSLDGGHYCNVWAPEIVELAPSSFMLHFTATRHASARASCPGYNEDSGIYLARSDKPTGPFARTVPSGGVASCPIRDQLPRSLDDASDDCQGTFCHHIMRLDSNVFRDGDRWWMAYAWYTNSPTRTAWEQSNHGEHVSLVELDPNDPFSVRCASSAPQIALVNPHDATMREAMSNSCERCSEMLSFSRGRFGEEMTRDGYGWGVSEAPSLFRRNGMVYALVSHSAWDSAYYSVAWIAAPSVPELAVGSSTRIVGRYLVPSRDMSFGHGSPVLGPDGTSWFYMHHRLQHGACAESGSCGRDVWLSPMEFEDRGDGRGDVWLRARFPAENPKVSVTLPALN